MRFRPPSDYFSSLFFPSAATGIEPIEHLQLRSLGKRFVKRTPLVHVNCADEKCHVGSDIGVDHVGKFLESRLNGSGTANHGVAEKIYVL